VKLTKTIGAVKKMFRIITAENERLKIAIQAKISRDYLVYIPL